MDTGRHSQDAAGKGAQAPASEFAARLAAAQTAVPFQRLAATVGAAVEAMQTLIRDLHLTPAELRTTIEFLTSVGHHSDPRRQEWVLLADTLGLSSAVEDLASPRPAGATPNTIAGPFYRADAPEMTAGASISRDGRGTPLAITGRVRGLDGAPVSGATVEVWQANGEGRYENQEPDHQPDHNLRGRFATDAQGRFAFLSVMPKGYALPGDGPVGRLMTALGLTLDRPAHIHFRISAPGHERLTTHVYDRDDPAIGRDAIFGVKPGLLAEFRPIPMEEGAAGRTLDLELVLCPLRQGDPKPEENICR